MRIWCMAFAVIVAYAGTVALVTIRLCTGQWPRFLSRLAGKMRSGKTGTQTTEQEKVPEDEMPPEGDEAA